MTIFHEQDREESSDRQNPEELDLSFEEVLFSREEERREDNGKC